MDSPKAPVKPPPPTKAEGPDTGLILLIVVFLVIMIVLWFMNWGTLASGAKPL